MAIRFRRDPNSYFARMTLLKKLFWLYFLLLIFEGALRKWVAPELSAPLLVIRDPVSIWIVWEAYRTHKWPQRWSAVISALTVGLVGCWLIQSVAGASSWLIGLYGLRSYLLPFPVLFIMGENLDEEDIRRIGAFTLWLLPPMALLEVAQYMSPGSSFLNRGAYEGEGQIGFANSHVRASGTFSFATGAVQMDLLAACFILYGMIKKGLGKNWLLWASAFALLLSTPMTGARGLVYQLAATIACVVVGAFMGASQFVRVLRIIVPLLIVAFMVSLLPVFSDAAGLLMGRFEDAKNLVEGDPWHALIFRGTTPIVDALEDANFMNSWIGVGIGHGAIAVSAMLNGTRDALAGDNVFARELLEMGPIVGIAYQLYKLFMATMVIGGGLAAARRQEPLALLLIPMAAVSIIYTSPEQPTAQGFLVISTGIAIAAGRMAAFRKERTTMRPLVRPQPSFHRRQRGISSN